MRTVNNLTQDLLRELFSYDPETGYLYRRHATKGYDANRKIARKNDSGYLITTINGKTYRVHHLVWMMHYGYEVDEIDHINRVKDDNRIENLRQCEHYKNCGNNSPRVHKYKGITFCKQTQKWRAQIGINYRNVPLGRYSTQEEAALAYNKAALEYFGEFAVLNEVDNAIC